MEGLHSWKMRFSFKNATIVVCFFNLLVALLLLQGFLSAASNRRLVANQPDADHLRYIHESEEIRRAMEPLELIKKVREIQQQSHVEPQAIPQKNTIKQKQTAAVDLSKRLKDFRNDAASLRALEEWRKRKMERARQRQLEKNLTAAS